MKTTSLYFIVSVSLLLTACTITTSGGSGRDGVDPAVQAKIDAETAKCDQYSDGQVGGSFRKYIITTRHNGSACTTGCHIFASTGDYCTALQNDALNDFCGSSQRAELYQADCGL